MMKGALSDISKAVGNTPIVQLRRVTGGVPVEIYVKCEFLNPGGSHKDRLAANMLRRAEEGGLKSGGTIVEATSGNTGASLALLAALACQRAAPPPAAPPPVAPTPAPPPSRPAAPDVPGPTASPGESATAARWIAALRQKGTAAITTLARAPFDFRDTRTTLSRGCGSHVASDPRGVAVVAGCLAKDKDLRATLLANPEPRLFAISKETLPGWAKPWAGGLPPGLRPMSTFIHGDKAAFEMILLVTEDGVHGVWQNVTYEPK
ncbi:MAG TPA: pyridoxal-phosphate dependent enzyme [Polyangia bacterium]|nr:pyridoxal-phosphate dependent enzyme [Polyangia bacterium]